jgi:glutaredoxin
MSMKSAVDRLDQKSGKYFQVVRVGIHTEFGSYLKREVGSELVPALILYGDDGMELNRFHNVPDFKELKSKLVGSD